MLSLRKLNMVVAAFSLETSLFRGETSPFWGLSRFTFVAQVESVERPDFALGAPDPENCLWEEEESPSALTSGICSSRFSTFRSTFYGSLLLSRTHLKAMLSYSFIQCIVSQSVQFRVVPVTRLCMFINVSRAPDIAELRSFQSIIFFALTRCL